MFHINAGSQTKVSWSVMKTLNRVAAHTARALTGPSTPSVKSNMTLAISQKNKRILHKTYESVYNVHTLLAWHIQGVLKVALSRLCWHLAETLPISQNRIACTHTHSHACAHIYVYIPLNKEVPMYKELQLRTEANKAAILAAVIKFNSSYKQFSVRYVFL
jgi:hypothetical protein